MILNIFSRTGGALKEFLPNVTQDFDSFIDWLKEQHTIAHDLETTYTDSILDREMLVATYYSNNVVWVIFVLELTPIEFQRLKDVMPTKTFLVQMFKFEYKMWKKYDVTLEKFHDTYLTEKMLGMGYNNWKNDLASLTKKYLDIDMSKELQTSFVDNKSINDAQLEYAVNDVLHLEDILKEQSCDVKDHDAKFQVKLSRNKNRGLRKAIWWTHEFYKVVADLEYYGIGHDEKQWLALYEEHLPKVQDATKHLDKIVFDDFYTLGVACDFIYAEDTPVPKLFSSAIKKKKFLNIVYKDLEKVSKDELKKYLYANDSKWPKGIKPSSKKANDYLNKINIQDKFVVIKLILSNNIEEVLSIYKKYFRDVMIKNELLIPKDSIIINWASSDQRKAIFQWIHPGLKSTEVGHLEEIAFKHRLIQTYLDEYQEATGKVTKFGIKYLEHIDSDGRARTNINPVLNTGRISSSKPNVLNITKNPRYRAAFVSAPGYNFVMADYTSQELALTGLMAKEISWLEALVAGHDLHNINASRIFKDEWEADTEHDCNFKKTKGKCLCKNHKEARVKAKTAGFGIIYGISKFGLSFNLKVDLDEGERIIEAFYAVSPAVRKYFRQIGHFAINNGYAPEAGLGACRYYDPRKLHYDKESIIRTSGNFTIQGLGASILKVCTVLIRRHIRHMNHDARIVLFPYDEIIMEVAHGLEDYWKDKLKYYMELAGKLVLNLTVDGKYYNILKVDNVVVDDHWIH